MLSLRPFILIVLISALPAQFVLAVTKNSPSLAAPLPLNAAAAIVDSNLTQERLETARKTVETDPKLAESDKKKALEIYDQALGWFKEAGIVNGQLSALETQIRDAPKRLTEVRAQLAALKQPSSTAEAALDNLNLAQIEALLGEETLALAQHKEGLRQREEELSRLLVGSKALTEDSAARLQALEEIDRDLAVAGGVIDTPVMLKQAQLSALKARRLLRLADLDLLKRRLATQGLLTDLAQAERDLLAAQIAMAEPLLVALKQHEQQLHEAQAAAAREQAEQLKDRLTTQLPPVARDLADENTAFRRELQDVVAQEQQLSEVLQATDKELEELKADWERTRQRVAVVGPSPAVGRLLRQRRQDLPKLQDYRRRSGERARAISRATDRQLDIDDLLRQAPQVEKRLDLELRDATTALKASERDSVEQNAKALLQARRASLNELQKVYGRYSLQLSALDVAERRRVEVANAFIAYIDEQLLWIPSTGLRSLFTRDGHAPAWYSWLAQVETWQRAGRDGISAARAQPLPLSLLALGLLMVLSYRQRIPARLREISQSVRKIRTDSFALTLQALAFGAMRTLPLPLTLFGLGWLLQQAPNAHPFSLALAAGLEQLGLFLGSLGLVRQFCREHNLGERHLQWPEPVRLALLRSLRVFIPIGAVQVFFLATTASAEAPPLDQALGGFAFITLMLASALIAARLLGRDGAVKREVFNIRHGHWASHLYFLWFPVAVGTPLLLALLAIFGYHYTAVHLEQKLQMTLWFFFGLLLVRDLILRALFVTERRLRFEAVLRRRDELRTQRSREDGLGMDEEAASLAIEIPEVDYASLSEQSKRLVHAGFLFASLMGSWAIWNALLPALGFLTGTELPLQATRIIDGVPKDVPVTLRDLTVGLFFTLVTVLAAKNLPGVLEISLLRRLPLDAGARYAITALSQYAIAGIGVLIAFNTLGLQWSNVQWLLAALSVGLGFGLQEIVANFISGIILLFERPIRVGDVVTVDHINGVVSRIRIRATTITNFDKQDLIVPNKEFITGRLINWTLTDKMNRLVISVGIAYGSDVRRAMELIAGAAAANEQLLKEPKPLVTFEGFGDNALNLKLRCYLGSLDHRLATLTALHTAINDALASAEIDIAFPQRDVHLATHKPLEIRLHGYDATLIPTPRKPDLNPVANL